MFAKKDIAKIHRAGDVVFLVNGSVLSQSTLTASGSVTAAATFNTATLPHGTHRVDVVYLGVASVCGRDHDRGELAARRRCHCVYFLDSGSERSIAPNVRWCAHPQVNGDVRHGADIAVRT